MIDKSDTQMAKAFDATMPVKDAFKAWEPTSKSSVYSYLEVAIRWLRQSGLYLVPQSSVRGAAF
jgi:Zn-dependent membrane protease YugP